LTASDVSPTLWMTFDLTLASASASIVLIAYAHRVSRRSQIEQWSLFCL
jgi:hypothetical protein